MKKEIKSPEGLREVINSEDGVFVYEDTDLTIEDFDRKVQEYIKQNLVEEVDIESQSVVEDTTGSLNGLDTNAPAEIQYDQLANIFLDRKGKRKLAKFKKKDTFTSNLYKNIKL